MEGARAEEEDTEAAELDGSASSDADVDDVMTGALDAGAGVGVMLMPGARCDGGVTTARFVGDAVLTSGAVTSTRRGLCFCFDRGLCTSSQQPFV